MSIAIGAHVDQTDPIAEAEARNAPTWCSSSSATRRATRARSSAYAGGADGLRADAEAAGIDLYVHAPYIVNVATTNNRIRIPSRKLLQQHVDAAAAIGAQGPDRARRPRQQGRRPAKGFDNWRKAVEATDLKLPLLIENTAGGDNAMTRYLDRIGRVWDAISAAEQARQGRLLPRHLPRPRRRQRARDRRRGRPRDHRPDRPGALQRQPRRVRLRRRPARQLRRRPGSTPTCWPRSSATPARRSCCETPGGADEHAADFAGCASASDGRSAAPGRSIASPGDRPLTVRTITTAEHLDVRRGPSRSASFLQTPAWGAGRRREWRRESLGWFRRRRAGRRRRWCSTGSCRRLKRYLAYLPEGPVIDWDDRRPRRLARPDGRAPQGAGRVRRPDGPAGGHPPLERRRRSRRASPTPTYAGSATSPPTERERRRRPGGRPAARARLAAAGGRGRLRRRPAAVRLPDPARTDGRAPRTTSSRA